MDDEIMIRGNMDHAAGRRPQSMAHRADYCRDCIALYVNQVLVPAHHLFIPTATVAQP
jgi:hypothetical protein